MLVEPITPPLAPLPPTTVVVDDAAARARAARGWLDLGLHLANRPGVADPTPGMLEALTNATEAIREAIAACDELHARQDLHLALDEAADGIAALTERGADARRQAVRTANTADWLLDRALATLTQLQERALEGDEAVR